MTEKPLAKRAWLDAAYAKLRDNDVADGMNELVLGLRDLRKALPAAEWSEFVQLQCLPHPLKELVHQDPFTHRSYAKPRGYAGDAELLDYIYGIKPLPETTTPLGAEIYRYTSQAPACQSVRARCEFMATVIDALAAHTTPKILAIACGHLREAQRSRAVAEGRTGAYFALDQDPVSLAVIEREQPGVQTVSGSVKSLLKGERELNDLDLVYSAGLYDYLAQPMATALTHRLFKMLKAGGKLLVANFAPELRDIGYMESFMAWHLTYRNEAEMEAFAAHIPTNEILAQRVFRDEHQNIVFLEIVKR
jgi:hypothetical protein